MKDRTNKIILVIIMLLQVVSIFTTITSDKLYWFKYTKKDYIKIKHIIMEERKMTRWDLYKLDVNNDGKVTSLDYVIIRNRLED